MAKATAKQPAIDEPIKIDASSVSIAIASPSFGCTGGVAHAAEQLSLTLQRSCAQVGFEGGVNRVGFDAGFVPASEQPPIQAAVSFHAPTEWQLNRQRRLLGVLTTPTNVLPTEWETSLSYPDCLLCPSEWILDGAQAAGRPAALVRFGIDATTFTPAKRERGAKLRVLFFATNAEDRRKGLDLAIEAFKRAFERSKDVEMIVRSTKAHGVERDDERMRFECGALTPKQLADLYRSCDVLLHPSRAEAFGAVPLEAMATGMPAIHSGMTGMQAYDDLGLVVATRPVPGTYGPWREPYLSTLVDRLRQVDEDYDAVMRRAHQDARAVAQRFSWEATVASLLPLISQ